MTAPAISVRGPLLEGAEVRFQRAANREGGVYLLMVRLQKPSDSLPVAAELRIGLEGHASYQIAQRKASQMRRGTVVQVEAEGWELRRTGRGKARQECLALKGVTSITLPDHAGMPANAARFGERDESTVSLAA